MQKYINYDDVKIKAKELSLKDILIKETNLSFIKNILSKCPLCGSGSGKNKTSAFHVTNNLYNCHSCGEGGDVLQFITKFKQLGFTETLQYINSVYLNGSGTATTTKVFNKNDEATTEYKTDKEIVKDFINYIDTHVDQKEYNELKAYLDGRNIDISNDIHLLTNYNQVNNHLKKTYSTERLKASGLFNDKINLIYYDHHIIFTHRWDNEVFYTHARTTNNEQPNKYLYQRGKKYPFNLDALNNQFTTVYITEGVLDTISLLQDYKHSISLGSTNTDVKTIKFIGNKAKDNDLILKFVFDSDEAAHKALISDKYKQYAQILSSLSVNYEFSQVVGAKDINELYSKVDTVKELKEDISTMNDFIFYSAVSGKWYDLNKRRKAAILSILVDYTSDLFGIELNEDSTKFRVLDFDKTDLSKLNNKMNVKR